MRAADVRFTLVGWYSGAATRSLAASPRLMLGLKRCHSYRMTLASAALHGGLVPRRAESLSVRHGGFSRRANKLVQRVDVGSLKSCH